MEIKLERREMFGERRGQVSRSSSRDFTRHAGKVTLLTGSRAVPTISTLNVPTSVSSELINYTANNKLSFIFFSINYPLRASIHISTSETKPR